MVTITIFVVDIIYDNDNYDHYEPLVNYPLVMTNSLLLKMTAEIVSFPIKHGDFP